jgi:hypothetical protein
MPNKNVKCAQEDVVTSNSAVAKPSVAGYDIVENWVAGYARVNS